MRALSHESRMDLKNSTRLRAEAFVQGTKFVLTQQNRLSDNIREQIDALLSETQTIIAQDTVAIHHYNRIVNKLINNLSKTSGLREKDIALGEAYWSWQIYERPKRTTKIEMTHQNQSVTLKISESVIEPRLTQAQKEVLIQIHASPIADWVKTLTSWEQTYLKTIIPKQTDRDWSGYEKVLPATLRRIPGLSNATQKIVSFTDSEGRTFNKRGYRQGVPTAYAMPSSHYQASAEGNIQQMLEAIRSDVKKDFRAYWELDSTSNLKSPVLLLGLLTHKEYGNALQKLIDTEVLYSGLTLSGEENNTLRTQDKSTAIQALQASYPDITLIDLNIGVNIGRGWVKGVPVDNFIVAAETALSGIRTEKTPLTPVIKTRVTEAENAISALKLHNTKALQSGRNKDLFTAALSHYVTEKLGGSVITNCKSAKDRTGLEIIMADAIDIYVHIYGEIPQYDEQNEAKRKQFIDIFKAIFDSQHHQLIANDNSPGSQGIKDEGMLDSDIIASLGHTYTLGKKIADLNKPKSFFQKNSKIIFRSLIFLGFIASIGLIATGVFAPLGLILGYVLSAVLPFVVSFGVYGGYAAYDARQTTEAVQQYDDTAREEGEVPLLSTDEEDEDDVSEVFANQSADPRSDSRRDTHDEGADFQSKRRPLAAVEDVMLVDSGIRTITEVKSAMSEVVDDLNGHTVQNSYKSKYKAQARSVQILEKTTDSVVMEASTARVAMYRPLLEADIDLQDKAILFLKALGIPPIAGKETIKIRGGHHDLRQAIRAQFKEYRDNPQPQTKTWLR